MPDLIGGMGDPKQVGAMIDPIVQKAVQSLQGCIVGVASNLPDQLVTALQGLTITITISRKP